MATNQITWQLILHNGYLAQCQRAARNSLVVICMRLAWEDILRTMTIAMWCYITLIGKAVIKVALMTAKSPTICWAIINISYPTQEKNAAKSSMNGIYILVLGRRQRWQMVNTIPIGLGEAALLLVWKTGTYQIICSTIKGGIYLPPFGNVARDIFTTI